MNKFIGIGRLTKDPEVRYTQSNKAVAGFTIAIDRRKGKDGQQQADFVQCVAWDKLAEVIRDWVKKGTRVGVEGRVQTRSYDAQDGSKRYVTEIVVNELEFLDSKKAGDTQSDAPAGQFCGTNADDDDVPF